MKLLVTGGAGFIGSALCRHFINNTTDHIINVDCLTYAGSLDSLESIADHPRYSFEQVDIRDRPALAAVFEKHRPESVLHLAAESHVDRSIDGPEDFISTNIVGTYQLLESSRNYLQNLDDRDGGIREKFRFHHVSTDEVFGSLGADQFFSEDSPYAPNSPYSASKAAADHLVRAWGATFNLKVLISNCSNNFGPFQYPEKLIPLIILNALEGKELPIYGDGRQVRDWLFVDDHVRGLELVLKKGQTPGNYMIGGRAPKENITVVESICDILDELSPDRKIGPRRQLMTFVKDRPGHDRRYAVDATKIERELGFFPIESFESALRKTVHWYLEFQNRLPKFKENTHHKRLGLGGLS